MLFVQNVKEGLIKVCFAIVLGGMVMVYTCEHYPSIVLIDLATECSQSMPWSGFEPR